MLHGALLLAALSWLTPHTGASDSTLACARALTVRLHGEGRGEARFVQVVASEQGRNAVRGTLALEAPDRLRMDYAGSGERITLRRDGGEWLQPSLKQMLILTGGRALEAAALWNLLQGEDGGRRFHERRVGRARYEVVAREAGTTLPETLWVETRADGLPSLLESRVGDTHWILRLSEWRFVRPHGPRAFTQVAPAGYETVEMP